MMMWMLMLTQPDVSLSTHLVGEPPGVDDERLVDHQYRMGDTNRQTYLLQQQENKNMRAQREMCVILSQRFRCWRGREQKVKYVRAELTGCPK